MDAEATRAELLPCPFCGGEAGRFTIGRDEPNNAGGDVICCKRCQASSYVEFGRKENLVSRWNTRTRPAEPDLRAVLEEARPYVEAYCQEHGETGTLLQSKLVALLARIDAALHASARDLRAVLEAGTLSMTGHRVIIDFDTRDDAEAMFAALNASASQEQR